MRRSPSRTIIMTENTQPVEFTTELTVAWLGNQNNRVSAEDVPALLRTMHSTILALEYTPRRQ